MYKKANSNLQSSILKIRYKNKQKNRGGKITNLTDFFEKKLKKSQLLQKLKKMESNKQVRNEEGIRSCLWK